jgi:hypothetical protein
MDASQLYRVYSIGWEEDFEWWIGNNAEDILALFKVLHYNFPAAIEKTTSSHRHESRRETRTRNFSNKEQEC